jgi:glc operon protein GlcG
MPDFVATHRITHEASLKMIAAGIAKANEIGVKVSFAIVDASGSLIAFLMMDGARFFSGRATIKKAITSASQRLATGYVAEERVVSMQIRMDGDFTNMPGGFPVVVGGQVIGGVGAGGAKEDEDVVVAKAMLAALGM